jgi:hypothetical protein
MRKIAYRFVIGWLILMSILAPLAAAEMPRMAATKVTLSDARFNGLTRIVATTNVALTGIEAAHVIVTRPDGSVIPASLIRKRCCPF